MALNLGGVATILNSQKPSLQVNSNVLAAIYVDDNRRRTTPAAILLDPIKNYNVRIEADGYISETRTNKYYRSVSCVTCSGFIQS